jgi:ribosomal protein S18 acetylase RimI-like enzyme
VEIEYRTLRVGDGDVLSRVASGVFDNEIDKSLAEQFLADPRHHLAVAIAGDLVVGFASAVHYIHPDKAPEFFVNEVGVSPQYQRRGIATELMRVLLNVGKRLGCTEAWVLTEPTSTSAMRLYQTAGGTATEGYVMFTFPLNAQDGS